MSMDRIGRLFRNSDACLHVAGSSMDPLLKNGDRIRIVPKPPRTGDIAVFLAGGLFFVHRIVWRKGDFFYTIGDNSPVPDHPVHRKDIVGVIHRGQRVWPAVCSGLFRICIYRLKQYLRTIRQGLARISSRS